MNTPGFTAENSLGRASKSYAGAQITQALSTSNGVRPSMMAVFVDGVFWGYAEGGGSGGGGGSLAEVGRGYMHNRRTASLPTVSRWSTPASDEELLATGEHQ
jgi:hypothetical protein